MTGLQAEKILAVLNEHGVRYVLIGGLAAALHGSVTPTFDVDITPEMTRENLHRLSAALDELDARVRVEGVPDGLRFAHDATSLASITTLNLVTRHGDLDIATQPAGVTRYRTGRPRRRRSSSSVSQCRSLIWATSWPRKRPLAVTRTGLNSLCFGHCWIASDSSAAIDPRAPRRAELPDCRTGVLDGHIARLLAGSTKSVI